MRGAQDIAVALQSALSDLMPAEMASMRSRYNLVEGLVEGGLDDISSVVDTPIIEPQPNDLPQIQIEVTGKRAEPAGTVEPEWGGTSTLDSRFTARLWVFLRGQSFPDVARRQRYTAQAIEEVLMTYVVLPSDSTIRTVPTTIAYDLSDVGIDQRAGRSFGGIRFTLDVILTEQTEPLPPLGTAEHINVTVQPLDVVSAGLA